MPQSGVRVAQMLCQIQQDEITVELKGHGELEVCTVIVEVVFISGSHICPRLFA